MGSGCTTLVGQKPEALESFHASCTMECLHCHLKAYVDNGRIVRIESDNPYEGKGCARGLSRVYWSYADNRVLTPLKRIGEKGEGKFKPISWDEALNEIASKMKQAIASDGAKSILMTSASGNMDSFANSTMKTFGAYLGGVTFQAGSLCCSAVTAAMTAMVGMRYVDTRDTIEDAKYIVCWGNNPIVTMQAYWPRYLKAKERGAKIIVIDPRRSETAARADAWIPIAPGTDPVLALGMIRIFAEEHLLDEAFLKAIPAHLSSWTPPAPCSRKMPRTLPRALCLTRNPASSCVTMLPDIDPALDVKGLPVPKGTHTVLELVLEEARDWTLERVGAGDSCPGLRRRPARTWTMPRAVHPMILSNMGSFQRVENGTYAAAAHYYLAILTGNIGRAGTGVCDRGWRDADGEIWCADAGSRGQACQGARNSDGEARRVYP